jgi:hypothetical protein
MEKQFLCVECRRITRNVPACHNPKCECFMTCGAHMYRLMPFRFEEEVYDGESY